MYQVKINILNQVHIIKKILRFIFDNLLTDISLTDYFFFKLSYSKWLLAENSPFKKAIIKIEFQIINIKKQICHIIKTNQKTLKIMSKFPKNSNHIRRHKLTIKIIDSIIKETLKMMIRFQTILITIELH